jgi:hypothetical protein
MREMAEQLRSPLTITDDTSDMVLSFVAIDVCVNGLLHAMHCCIPVVVVVVVVVWLRAAQPTGPG